MIGKRCKAEVKRDDHGYLTVIIIIINNMSLVILNIFLPLEPVFMYVHSFSIFMPKGI